MKQFLASRFPELRSCAVLAANLERMGFSTLFPVQQLALDADTDQNVFIQAPCGSGKTLAALLPFLTKQSGQVVVYVCPNLLLSHQVRKLLEELCRDVTEIQLFENKFELLARPVPTNKRHFIVATSSQLQLFLRENELFIHQPTTLVIDEADQQIKEAPQLFRQIFLHLQKRGGNAATLNNSAFSQRNSKQNLHYFMLSATLRAQESIFNSLQLMPGQLIQLSQTKQNSSAALVLNSTDSLEALYTSLKIGLFPLPGIVFFESVSQLSQVTMNLLKSYQNEPYALNIWMEAWREVSSPFLNVNQPLQENQIIFTLDQNARGLDIAQLRSAVSVGVVDTDLLTHRLGRAGRGLQEGFGFVFLPPSYPAEAQVKQTLSAIGNIQVFQDLAQFVQEKCRENGIETQVADEAEAALKTFTQWAKQQPQEDIGLHEYIEKL